MKNEETSILLHKSTARKLKKLKKYPTETYESIIIRLIDKLN